MSSIFDTGGFIGYTKNYPPSPLVENGLVLYLDAGDQESYPGTGTTWYDLSPSKIHLTLFNSPSFERRLGYFDFNGLTMYAKSTAVPMTNTDNYALMAVVNPNALGQLGMILSNGRDDAVNSPSTGYGFGMGSGTGTAGSNVQGLNSSVAWLNSGYTFLKPNDWYFIVMTREAGTTKFYVNGVQTATTSTSVPNTPTQNCVIGAGFASTAARFFNGKVAIAGMYNTALTSAQVIQNFNYVRERFKI